MLKIIQRMAALLLCLLVLLPTGCERPPKEESASRQAYSDPQALPYDQIRFASERQKKRWIKPLTERLASMKPRYDSLVIGEGGPSYSEYLASEGIVYGCGLALYDIDLDGVPELLCDLGGGSMGNGEFIAYDLYTGEIVLEHLSGTIDGGWCVYYDTESARFCHIGQLIYRLGWSEKHVRIRRIWAGELTQEPVLDISYRCRMGSWGEEPHELYWEVYDTALFGEPIPVEDYLGVQSEFFRTHIRIPQTEMTVIPYWTAHHDDIHTEPPAPISPQQAEQLARALLFSGQEFLIPNP